MCVPTAVNHIKCLDSVLITEIDQEKYSFIMYNGGSVTAVTDEKVASIFFKLINLAPISHTFSRSHYGW